RALGSRKNATEEPTRAGHLGQVSRIVIGVSTRMGSWRGATIPLPMPRAQRPSRSLRRPVDSTWHFLRNIARGPTSEQRRVSESQVVPETATEQQNQEDNENQAGAPARVVAPARAVRPCWQRSDHDQDEDNDENESPVASSFMFAAAPRDGQLLRPPAARA